MATIRAYTTIEQSRKLAEILPLESADMYYEWPNKNAHFKDDKYSGMGFSCWSLASLLSVIRETIGYTLLGVNNFGVNNVYMSCILGDEPWKLETEVYDNEIDVCYEMIIKLHELNLL